MNKMELTLGCFLDWIKMGVGGGPHVVIILLKKVWDVLKFHHVPNNSVSNIGPIKSSGRPKKDTF